MFVARFSGDGETVEPTALDVKDDLLPARRRNGTVEAREMAR
jgi:hypothetical protein